MTQDSRTVAAADFVAHVGEIVFYLVVYGAAQPAGSKRVVPIGKGNKKQFIVTDANRKSRPWKNEIKRLAGEAMHGRALLDGPLAVTFRFMRARPKGHFGKRGLRPSAPRHPTSKPDLLKLARAVEDALQGVVYRDDAAICRELLIKEYGEPERVEITIARMG